jgi:hypothetical protein
VKDALSERLARCYTAAVNDVMCGMGLRDFVLPHEIAPLRHGLRAAGPAFTFRGRVAPGVTAHDTYMGWTSFLSKAPAGCLALCQPNDRTVVRGVVGDEVGHRVQAADPGHDLAAEPAVVGHQDSECGSAGRKGSDQVRSRP